MTPTPIAEPMDTSSSNPKEVSVPPAETPSRPANDTSILSDQSKSPLSTDLDIVERVQQLGSYKGSTKCSIRLTKFGYIFRGKKAFLSNMFPCKLCFKVRGSLMTFSSSEQCYQYLKAIHNKNYNIADGILQSADPFNTKSLGDSVQKDPAVKWDNLDKSILKKVAYEKFAQYPKLMVDLLRTHPEQLIEGTKDIRWGGGHEYSSKEYNVGNITGENLFGKILVDLRNEYRTEYDLDI